MDFVVAVGRFLGASWALIGFAVLAASAFLPVLVSSRRRSS